MDVPGQNLQWAQCWFLWALKHVLKEKNKWQAITLLPVHCQDITQTSAQLLFVEPLGTYSSNVVNQT